MDRTFVIKGTFVAVAFVFLISLQTFAQEDACNPFQLKDVTIYGSRLKESDAGLYTVTFDSLLYVQSAGDNFSELIRKIGAGQIRSYGPSGLSTPSFRGTRGSQTLILWNGIALNDPLNGSYDISQLPVTAADEIVIQKGGSSSLYGNGAIGGSIRLDNHFFFDKGTSISIKNKTGSFGNRYLGVQVEKSKASQAFSLSFYNRYLKNNFPYVNDYQRPEVRERRANASYRQSGLLQQVDLRVGGSQILGFKLWTHRSEYEIPNPIFHGRDGSATQHDESIRGLFHWYYIKRALSLTYKQAFFYNQLNFEDPAAQINSVSMSGTWTHRAEGALELSANWRLINGINHTYEYAGAENFGSTPPKRNNTAFFSSLRYISLKKNLWLTVNIRQELTDNKRVPAAPSFGINYLIGRKLAIRGNISKNYRIPTFNDLYWRGGGGYGNPALLAEFSRGGEVGVDLSPVNSEHLIMILKATAYSLSVNNWIYWRKVTANEWSPDNIKKVWARGLEMAMNGTITIPGMKFNVEGSYHLTKTTNREISNALFRREKGRQLDYTPLHETALQLMVRHKQLSLGLRHNYVGRQYTDGENSEVFALPAYQLISTSLNYGTSNNKASLNFFAEINNLANISYENRRGYPMYGRNFSLGVMLKFNRSAEQ